MKVKEAFILTLKELKLIYSIEEATSIAKWIFEDLGYRISPLSRDEEKNLDDQSSKKLLKIIARLSNHEPIQHILGYIWFYGEKFLVSDSVLIPRQETELLVDLIINEFPEDFKGIILDIGTGSGVIACSLAKKWGRAEIFASDISDKALEVARKNMQNLMLNIIFINDDILQFDLIKYPENIDLIISNPPYVRNSEKKLMQKNVLDFDPETALFVDDNDPLIFYREITRISSMNLKVGGKLYFEINEAFGDETAELVSKSGFENIRIIKDLNGKERIIHAQKI